ncbi:hypothetical protein A6J40_17225 [Legionella longbeachae]|nr:hypothetical protein A6J40_17225 [Legionella longbeachae]EEZ94118.1 hypothetical protein LLB_3018 [Legionella longbeachae D-4968]
MIVNFPWIFGKQFVYGFGIAINNNDLGLLDQINQALIQFESSGEFKKTMLDMFHKNILV